MDERLRLVARLHEGENMASTPPVRIPRLLAGAVYAQRVTQPVRGGRRLTRMSDDSLLWTHKPAPRCRPRPGEPLWSVQHGDVTWTAELFFHGEGVGWEAKIFRDGELSLSRTYLLRDVAAGWAKNERDRLGKDDPLW